MHELSIAKGIVEICAERAGDARVTRVRLEIGQLSAVMPDAVRFCFDVCAKDTVLEGAELEIIETAGRALCRDCDSTNLRVIAGDELKIREMELA
jgi:hydrogenase nickel incorporation protein HypA/HybF